MADTIAITAGSGTTVSTEEITTLNGSAVSAQHIQRVAVASRTADGTAVDLIGSTADGLLVNLGTNNDVTVSGVSTLAEQQSQTTHLATIAGDTTNIETAVQIMDDWDNAASDGASVSGDVAHDSADAGEPVKIGMKAYELDGTAPQTAVAEADRVNAISDLIGRQYIATEHPRFFHVSVDYASAQTNASIKAAPGAGVAIYITDIMISNGATAGNITLLDGSGGTVLFELYPAINGGVSLNLKNPIKLTDNTALCITSTTVTTHAVFISGFID